MTSQPDEQPWRPEDAVTMPADTVAVPAPAQSATVPAAMMPMNANPGELLRFGPGVPVPATTQDMSQATAIWRGTAPQPADDSRRRRRLVSWLLPLLVLLAVLAILLWQRSDSTLTVKSAAVHVAAPRLSCGETATVTATMHTDGGSGTITYRWRRSDGTVSDTLRQQVTKGSTDTQVVLLWSFHGQGTMNATATLEVLSPNQISAAATFTYACP